MAKREICAARWLKPAEVAALFGVDRRTVLNWARTGKLTSQPLPSGHRRYKEADVLALLAVLSAPAPVEVPAEVAA